MLAWNLFALDSYAKRFAGRRNRWRDAFNAIRQDATETAIKPLPSDAERQAGAVAAMQRLEQAMAGAAEPQ